MTLRRQLLLVCLLTLVLPWAGCQFIRETESALREGQQQMLAGTAQAIADARRLGRKIGLCGQAPSDYPEFATFLVECGIDVYSYQPSMMHAKAVLVDGILSVVGSLNINQRSVSKDEETAIGILDKDKPAMFEANVLGTERVLKAALQTGVPRVVYISTVAAFGNTNGEVVDESHEHDRKYTSYYDETKHKAHKIARILIDEHGLPGIIVQPGSVYGAGDQAEPGEPGEHSELFAGAPDPERHRSGDCTTQGRVPEFSFHPGRPRA